MNDRRILVTGAAGFIGSYLANELADTDEVLGVDDESFGIAENLHDDVEYHDRSVLEDDLPTDVDVLFHLAAPSYPEHEANPARGARVNVEGFVNVVGQALEDGCETVVYASTSSVYGDGTEPRSESTAVEASTSFEASKLAREAYAEYFANRYGLSTAGMRLFSVYQGYAELNGRKAEYANVVGQFVDDAVHGRSPTVYGDGTETRDFIHVDDTVRGLIAAARHDLTGSYNVGTGRAVSLTELLEMIGAELGIDIDPEYIERPTSPPVSHPIADYSKLRDETGWKPSIALEDGLERLCAQYQAPEA